MNEKDIKRLIDLAKSRQKNQVSREKALNTFVMAGILDRDGNFTENFPYLAAAVDKKNK